MLLAALLLTLPLAAQTKVVRKNALKANDYGITYSLPKTLLQIDAEVTKSACKAGPYYKYAEKYLGVKNVVSEDNVYYELNKVTLRNLGVPDPDQTFVVEFKPGTVAPYAYLTEDGLLCTINADYETPAAPVKKTAPAEKTPAPADELSVYTEEFLMAGSVSKQAEVAAKQIYRIRESRMNILTGEADNLPPDGEAMKLVIAQLDAQEQALVSLFTGTCTKEVTHHTFSVVPQGDVEKEVLFRFSRLLGIVGADDLGGAPVYFNLKVTERAEPLPEKEAQKKAKSMKGIIYNVPGKATVSLVTDNKVLYKGEVQVTQFGSRESLAPVMFEDKKAPVKVYFYPETGALKQIVQ